MFWWGLAGLFLTNSLRDESRFRAIEIDSGCKVKMIPASRDGRGYAVNVTVTPITVSSRVLIKYISRLLYSLLQSRNDEERYKINISVVHPGRVRWRE